MKLLRYGPAGQEKPGMLDDQGRVRDLSSHVADIADEVLTPEGLARLAALDPAGRDDSALAASGAARRRHGRRAGQSARLAGAQPRLSRRLPHPRDQQAELDRLGAQGWELVSVVQASPADATRLYFKKPA